MKQVPDSLLAFQHMFPDDDACAAWLIDSSTTGFDLAPARLMVPDPLHGIPALGHRVYDGSDNSGFPSWYFPVQPTRGLPIRLGCFTQPVN